MGGCQNYGPFLGTLNTWCRIIIGIHKRDHNFDNHPYTWGLGFRDLHTYIHTYIHSYIHSYIDT